MGTQKWLFHATYIYWIIEQASCHTISQSDYWGQSEYVFMEYTHNSDNNKHKLDI